MVLARHRFLMAGPASLVLVLGLCAPATQSVAQLRPSVPATPRAEQVPARPDGGVPKPGETAKPGETGRSRVPLARQSLEQLFDRLAAAATPEEGKGIARLIQRRWARSGSDTADLLMSRAQEAIKTGDHPLAIEILDRLIAIEPTWAEGWNQRANVFFLMEDPVRAMLDIGEALKREPRHFGALGGLASILRQQGEEKLALKAYRQAMAIYPQMEGLKEQVDSLSLQFDGRDI